MNERQVGKFSLNISLVTRQPDLVAEVFRLLKVVPVRCECMFAGNVFEYTALSERFPEVPMGLMTPEYYFEIKCDKSGGVELVEVKPYEYGKYTEVLS